MNYFKPMLISVLVALSLSGCADRETDLEGKWVIDVEATVKNISKLGASPSGVAEMRKSFEGGRLRINHHQIKLSGSGQPEQVVIPYKYVSQGGSCFNLEIKAQIHSYCVHDETLEVFDPNTKLVVVYARK